MAEKRYYPSEIEQALEDFLDDIGNGSLTFSDITDIMSVYLDGPVKSPPLNGWYMVSDHRGEHAVFMKDSTVYAGNYDKAPVIGQEGTGIFMRHNMSPLHTA